MLDKKVVGCSILVENASPRGKQLIESLMHVIQAVVMAKVEFEYHRKTVPIENFDIFGISEFRFLKQNGFNEKCQSE